MEFPRFLPAGECGIVVELGDSIDPEINKGVIQLCELLEENELTGIEEIVPTYRSLFLSFNPLIASFEEVAELVRQVLPEAKRKKSASRRLVRVPVAYGGEFGPDLTDVALIHGLSEEEVIGIHSEREYLVYMLGFTPGFPYMGKVHPSIATPRLESPRLKVPRGSVGIAEFQTGIYPTESPGGWWLIGRTPLVIFSPGRTPPFLFRPGDYVRFFPISQKQYEEMESVPNHYEVEILLRKDGPPIP